MMRSALVALGLLGCGKVVGDTKDGPDIDADLHGVAKVTVLDVVGNGALAANIPVVFVNPDGTVVGDVTTDLAGRAEATILPGASVTAVWLQGTRYLVGTILDIRPGDDLRVGFTDRDSTSNGTFQVTFTGLLDPLVTYSIFTPCGETLAMPGTTTIMLRNDCRPDTFDVYVVAFRDGLITDYAQMQNVSLASGAVTIPNMWTSAQSFSATYTNVPAEITQVDSQRLSGSHRGFSARTSGMAMNGTFTAQSNNVPTAGANAFVRTTFSRSDMISQMVTQRIAGNSVNYNLNVGMQVTPWLTNIKFDPGSGTFTPSIEGMLTADMYATDLSYSRAENSFEWIVIGPAPATVTLPRLPDHVGPVAPLSTDSIGIVAALVVEASDVASWDDARTGGVFDLIDVAILGSDKVELVKSQLAIARDMTMMRRALFGRASSPGTQR
jgi:hypothetical protein